MARKLKQAEELVRAGMRELTEADTSGILYVCTGNNMRIKVQLLQL